MLLKFLSLPKETSMTQFLSDLAEHDLESEEDLKKMANYDQFRWTIKNWKSLFTGES